MKISNKDLLLLFGVLIAVIITLTTVIFKDEITFKNTSQTSSPKVSLREMPADLLNKAIDQMRLEISPSK